jgi:alanyl-tRNA synthetase
MKSVNDIRAAFLAFFKRNGHEVRPSSSLVPHNDPTLMFTNAGMNQFKNVFTGAEKLPFTRAATSQKCVRAGGKHNDLDNVGYTARHHTFFEMLGNFSFGDYFKEEAIDLAWELLTRDYGLNPEKLCVTVYHDDDVAWNHWKKISGFADHKIIRIATNDNFWSMGDVGPCGPCSEIFYDHGDKIAGGPPGSADADGDRFTEIWNLVFMQYEQTADGKRINLPKPSIDTGMGLERLSAVLQGVSDNYDIDLFKSLIKASQQESRNTSPESRSSHRIIADHLRSSAFLIADGVMPSNEGRGYVLRRIMRRAMRHAHQLGCKDPLMYRLVPSLVTEMGDAYPELKRAQAAIVDNLKQEEERFKETLGRGLKLLDEETARLSKGQKLAGEAAFKLYDTYGFPLDLTQDILKSRGIDVDTDGFEKAMEGQRDMARASHKGSGDTATGKIWFELKEKLRPIEFVGYENNRSNAKILAIVKNESPVSSAERNDEVYIVLDQTPFYGESGGQIGDTGHLLLDKANTISTLCNIVDTQKPLDDFIVHKTGPLSSKISIGDVVFAEIDTTRRDAIRANHSATHLLHKALRDTLGAHVTQKGSLVAPDRLRFDISHPKPVSREEIAAVERKVNEVVWRNTPVACKVMSPDEAINAGALALFGEKYGDKVRVLSMGEDGGSTYSTELCGGTHVRATGDIGAFKITGEGSVAAGIRRLEAVTGEGVRGYLIEELGKQSEHILKLQKENKRLFGELGRNVSGDGYSLSADHLKSAGAKELFALYEKEAARQQEFSQKLQDENKKLGKELAERKKQQALGAGGDVTKETIGNIGFIGKIFDGLDAKELRAVAEDYLKQADVTAVATNVEGKASVVVGVNKTLADKFSAVTLVQAAVTELGGKGGGGRPEMAQGGGPDADKLESALAKIKSLLAA